MRHLTLTFISLFCATILFAQTKPALTGRVVDAATGNAIEFADVVVTDNENNTVASTTVKEGSFTIDRVREGEFVVTVMLVGYQPFVSEPIAFGAGKSTDLGTISLSMNETGLEEVVVTGERSKIVYKLDRQRISGSSSLAASGGTAVDVLKLTPSVRVDAEGGVSFRGSSGFLVYVDGKQSALEGAQALDQIPAANIEDIEIITTPSARYKTDGDVGIINIITKRHDQQGVSGSVNVSGSTIGAWNTDVLLSYKKGASRWYVGVAGSEKRGKSDFDQTKTTIVDDYVTTSKADGIRESNNASYIGRVGWELGKNGHSLLVELQGGMTKTGRGGEMLYDEHRMKGDVVLNDNLYNSKDGISNEKQLAQIATDYVWKINERGDKFAITGRLRYDWYALEYTESNMFDMSGERYEGTRGYESEHHWDFDGTMSYQLNYREGGKAEVGYQYTSYSEHGDYNIKYWDRAQHDYVWQDDLHAPFFYRRQIHSAYLMLNDKFGPLSVEAGVRADHTIDQMDIEIEGMSRYIKRMELFPSAHLMYEAPGKNFISAGYSYRTNRPGIWQLEPYITYEDYYTKMTGNPDIKPEYIHSAEVGYRKTIAEENTISVTGYYRHRKGVRERVRVAYEPGVTLDSLINAGNDRTWGVEMSAQVKAARWWSMNVNASLFDYKFDADYEGCTDSKNTGYTASMINNFTLGRTSRLQFDANVVGPTVLTQGREDAYCYFDLAFRQQLFKNKISASIVAHDVFRTARYNNYRISPTLNSTTHVRPRYPNIVLSISYVFNSKHKEHTGAVSKGAVFEGKDF
ncbi:MAG: TonB-dependent receptor [Alistipes sp.]|nr:TonB-dependent receptor [Alistipes sp.]